MIAIVHTITGAWMLFQIGTFTPALVPADPLPTAMIEVPAQPADATAPASTPTKKD
jgi:hypothetical protein